MSYILKFKKNSPFSSLNSHIEFVEGEYKNYLFDKSKCCSFASSVSNVVIIGDCIDLTRMQNGFQLGKDLKSLMAESNGNFHAFELNVQDNQLTVFNSLFAVLPLYYFIDNESIVLSNSFDLLRREIRSSLKINKKFILQNVLLNYSINNDTFLEGINLVASNSCLQVDNNLIVKSFKYFNTENLFVSRPEKGQKILAELSDVFIEESKKFLPSEKFAVSFTGGFDGRTLVALSKSVKKDFFTYSFGNIGSSDLTLPASQSVDLDIDFIPILLDANYDRNYYKENLWEIVKESEGLAGINRAHYCYAANLLKEKTDFILTGNFGSEILRSLHSQGAVFAEELYHVFKDPNSEEWISALTHSQKLKYLNEVSFKSELEETVHDIKNWISSRTVKENNLLLYEFVLEELLRKYFGPEMVMQSNYFINRTPFLSIRFITELLKTKYAGAYGPYFSDNPVKRFKGQELYAHIIARTSPELLGMPTNKGYRPIDLLRVTGKVKLVNNYVRKRLVKVNDGDMDPFGVNLAYLSNREQLLKEKIESEYFNEAGFSRVLDSSAFSDDTNFVLRLLSMNKFIAEMNG